MLSALIGVLILTGSSDEPYHHWRETTAALREAMLAAGGFRVEIAEDPQSVIPRRALNRFDVVLMNYNGHRFPRATEVALEGYVASGKGFVAFHQACYGEFFGMEFRDRHWIAGPDDGWSAFSRMIGARWNPPDIGHARRTVFAVDWRTGEQPIVRGLPRSFSADDELYHKLQLDPGTQVLADAMSPRELGGTGRREPMIWTNGYGKGRVFFTTLGHDVRALSRPGLLTAMLRGIEWAATGEVRSN